MKPTPEEITSILHSIKKLSVDDGNLNVLLDNNDQYVNVNSIEASFLKDLLKFIEANLLGIEELTKDIAASKLKNLMREISEDYWCAGWLSGLEYELWDIINGNSREFGLGELHAEIINKLQTLSRLANGWWMWDNKEHREVFVNLDKWKNIVNAQILK